MADLHGFSREGHDSSPQGRINLMLLPEIPTSNMESDVFPFHYAAGVGDKGTLTRIIYTAEEQGVNLRKLLDSRDAYERTALMYAAVSNQSSCMQILLESGADPNLIDMDGRTALHWAASLGFHKAVKALLDHGAQVLVLDSSGNSPLHLALSSKSTKAFQQIVKSLGDDFNPNIQDLNGLSLLHLACYYDSVEHLKIILQHEANLRLTDEEGKLCLHWAAANKSADALKLLVSHFSLKDPTSQNIAIINTPDNEGRTLIHVAAANESDKPLSYLLSLPVVKIDALDLSSRTCLHYAAHGGLPSNVEKLLSASKDLYYIQDSEGSTSLHYAAIAGHAPVVGSILKQKVPDLNDKYGQTAFLLACRHDRLDILRLFLKFLPHIDLAQKDNNGGNGVHIAVSQSNVACLEFLLMAGASANAPDGQNLPPLFLACETGNIEVIKLLLRFKAEPSLVDDEGRSPLHFATMNGHVEACRLLLERSLNDVNGVDMTGRTPLHCAAFIGEASIVTLLLEHGAIVDVQDVEGITALHWAAASGSIDACIALVEKGNAYLNPTEHTSERYSPLDYATISNFEEIMAYLSSKGALPIAEIKELAASHIQNWWKESLSRITILSAWVEHKKEEQSKRRQAEKSPPKISKPSPAISASNPSLNKPPQPSTTKTETSTRSAPVTTPSLPPASSSSPVPSTISTKPSIEHEKHHFSSKPPAFLTPIEETSEEAAFRRASKPSKVFDEESKRLSEYSDQMNNSSLEIAYRNHLKSITSLSHETDVFPSRSQDSRKLLKPIGSSKAEPEGPKPQWQGNFGAPPSSVQLLKDKSSLSLRSSKSSESSFGSPSSNLHQQASRLPRQRTKSLPSQKALPHRSPNSSSSTKSQTLPGGNKNPHRLVSLQQGPHSVLLSPPLDPRGQRNNVFRNNNELPIPPIPHELQRPVSDSALSMQNLGKQGSRLQLRQVLDLGEPAPPRPTTGAHPVSRIEYQRYVSKKEKYRVHDVRTIVRSVLVIQKAVRIFLKKRDMYRQGLFRNRKWYSMRDRKIAALTIQLWWRQLLSRRYNDQQQYEHDLARGKSFAGNNGGPGSNRSRNSNNNPNQLSPRSKLQQQIYGTGAKKQAKGWIPHSHPPIRRPTYLRMLPAPSITAFNRAAHLYLAPTVSVQDYARSQQALKEKKAFEF